MRKNSFNRLYANFLKVVGENTTTAPARPKVRPQTQPAPSPSAPPKPRRAPGPFTPTDPLTKPKPKALVDLSSEEEEVGGDKLAAKFLKRRLTDTFSKYKN